MINGTGDIWTPDGPVQPAAWRTAGGAGGPYDGRAMPRVTAWAVLAVLGVAVAARPAALPRAASDLDAFMQQVLARRDENWKKLQQYVLDERERFEVRGPDDRPMWGEVRDYTWYLRDGFFVRSPVTVNGVAVSDADRRRYEADYLRRVKARDRRGRGAPPPAAADSADGDVQHFILQTRRPEFIDSAYFLRFTFEPSRYALVGRETFEGRDVLRIEYYPARLFAHEQDMQTRRRRLGESDASRDQRAAVERMMNKVSLVTIWVEPESHQIVKYTFDNVNLDFLPAAWLVHMNDAEAMMTMGQPIRGVWLPREIDLRVSGTLAVGAFGVRYHLDYSNYRKAEASSRYTIDDQGR